MIDSHTTPGQAAHRLTAIGMTNDMSNGEAPASFDTKPTDANERPGKSPTRIWRLLAAALLLLMVLILWRLQSSPLSGGGIGVASLTSEDAIECRHQSIGFFEGVVVDHADADHTVLRFEP